MADDPFSSTPPTKPAYYWWRPYPGFPPDILRVWKERGVLICKAVNPIITRPVADMGGQWAGPVEPPG